MLRFGVSFWFSIRVSLRGSRSSLFWIWGSGLKAHPTKSKFGGPTLPFLGHQVGCDGISPEEAKVAAIMPDHEEEEEDAQGGDAPADNLTFIAGGNNIDASAQHEIRPIVLRMHLRRLPERSKQRCEQVRNICIISITSY